MGGGGGNGGGAKRGRGRTHMTRVVNFGRLAVSFKWRQNAREEGTETERKRGERKRGQEKRNKGRKREREEY